VSLLSIRTRFVAARKLSEVRRAEIMDDGRYS
jgi:hypothetical protein